MLSQTQWVWQPLSRFFFPETFLFVFALQGTAEMPRLVAVLTICLVFRLLLEKGASIVAETEGGLGPLHFAAEFGSLEIVGDLLAWGAQPYVDRPSKKGHTPLLLAALGTGQGDFLGVCRVLIGAGADTSEPLFMATRLKSLTAVSRLLAAGGLPNVPAGCKDVPLVQAASAGCLDIVNTLMHAGAEVNRRGQGDSTALMAAAENSHAEVVKALIQAGAVVDLRGTGSVTALHLAATAGAAPIVEELLKAGAEKNAKDDKGATAVYRAADAGRKEVVRVLVAHKANTKLKNNAGESPSEAIFRHIRAGQTAGYVDIIPVLTSKK